MNLKRAFNRALIVSEDRIEEEEEDEEEEKEEEELKIAPL
jgi:hypothetical protein